MTDDVKAIAFYLPQYHPIVENDSWWGKGFTEWTNVVRARPAFPGHYQPHLPADLGFYDLRLPEVREAQAALAGEYGIHGFCYYHYWFNGRRLLQRPFDEVLASGTPNFPFCLCWANENWTRRWDGKDAELLVEQNYSEEDDIAHIRSLLPALRDHRYICIEGKPLLLIYRMSALPDAAATIKRWRAVAAAEGLPGLFLCNVESFASEHGLAHSLPLDAAVEFAPDWSQVPRLLWRGRRAALRHWLRHMRPVPNGYKTHRVVSYEAVASRMMAKPDPRYLRFPGVTPMWDNAARRHEGALVLHGSTPALYENWLSHSAQRVLDRAPDERIVFINAWNEWAEGNHLEPCLRWRRAYLEATRNALRGCASVLTHPR